MWDCTVYSNKNRKTTISSNNRLLSNIYSVFLQAAFQLEGSGAQDNRHVIPGGYSAFFRIGVLRSIGVVRGIGMLRHEPQYDFSS